jgi:hypothetical protein
MIWAADAKSSKLLQPELLEAGRQAAWEKSR